MTIRLTGRERWAAAAVGVSLALLPVATPLPLSSAFTPAAVAQTNKPVLRIGAIPDQKPEKLNRLYGLVANELSKQLNVDVKYVPVTNYAAAVSAFR
ncbi:MAG: PhnD/SsuA/transferrin family substrate-binding protein, partial [Vulcanococcus sp.]